MISRVSRGTLWGRLGFRLMAAFGIALMPLALLSYNQAQKYSTETEARLEAALFGETLLAATDQIETMNRARGMAAALAAAVVPTLDNVAACTKMMQTLVRTEPELSVAAFIPVDRKMTCASKGAPFDFSGDPVLAAALADPTPKMTVNVAGPISGESVLIFSHPVKSTNDEVLGLVSLSVPHSALQIRHSKPKNKNDVQHEPFALLTFDGTGTILSAQYGIDKVEERLPANHTLAEFVGKPSTMFRDTVSTGERRSFAIIAIVPGTLYVLGSWPAGLSVSAGFVGMLPLWAFPLAMWLASMLVAFLASENQILRHVRSLRKSIIAFASGNRQVDPPDMTGAPNELFEVGQAYETMMVSVLRDAAVMEDTIYEKEVLLREVHHRVKNNLQLIASIMNLQIRKSVSPEARSLLRSLHERVMSLATVHRELYQTSGLIDVRADELLESIVAQVLRMGARSDQLVESKTSFDEIRLTPDQAVPLSLILTEALTNALKHAGPAKSGKTNLSVTLKQDGPEHATLEVSNSMDDDAPAKLASSLESTGLGKQLLAAFASQLLGTLSMGPEGDRFFVRLAFPLKAPAADSSESVPAPADPA